MIAAPLLALFDNHIVEQNNEYNTNISFSIFLLQKNGPTTTTSLTANNCQRLSVSLSLSFGRRNKLAEQNKK